MSLSRAFTTRRLKLGGGDGEGSSFLPRRNNTTKAAPNPEIRHKISAPVQLIHTTNMLTYSAPDLPRPSRINSGSHRSEDDSDSIQTDSTPPTSPEFDRYKTTSPEPNHLTSYFMNTQVVSPTAPAIPKRAASHTKQNSYEALARNRSTSRMSRESENSISSRGGATFSRSASVSTQASSSSQSGTPLKTTAPSLPGPVRPQRATKEPFGQELAQVTELVEEYGTSQRLKSIEEEEEQMLQSQGLQKFSANDYICALQGLSTSFFPESNHKTQATALWI